jgi:hypothetical protein
MSYAITAVLCFAGGIFFGYGIGRARGDMEGFARGVKRGAGSKYL